MYLDASTLKVGDKVGISSRYNRTNHIGTVVKVLKHTVSVQMDKNNADTRRFYIKNGYEVDTRGDWHRPSLLDYDFAIKQNEAAIAQHEAKMKRQRIQSKLNLIGCATHWTTEGIAEMRATIDELEAYVNEQLKEIKD